MPKFDIKLQMDWKTFWLIIIIVILIIYIIYASFGIPLTEVNHYINCSCPSSSIYTGWS